jgi:import receptor subunit TOM70
VVDYTAICVLENFANNTAAESMERVIKALSDVEARARMLNRKPVQLAKNVLSSYMDSFASTAQSYEFPDAADELDPAPTDEDEGEAFYRFAELSMKQRRFNQAEEAYTTAAMLGCSNMLRARLMRGTFLFVRGSSQEAMDDFTWVLEQDPLNVEAMIKQAGLVTETGNFDAALIVFQQAIATDESCADAYYHRAQLYLVSGQTEQAIQDYQKAVSLDPSNVYAQIQLAVAQYRLGQLASAIAAFRRMLREFPTSTAVRNYYAEVLIDRQTWDEAEKILEEAERLDPENGLTYVNRATMWLQRMQQGNGAAIAEAEQWLLKALEVEPMHDVALAQMAQLKLQQSDLEQALEYFEKTCDIARTELELSQTIQYLEATRAQKVFSDRYPEEAARLRSMQTMSMGF